MVRALRRPLLLTGAPAVGKSATAEALAAGRPRAAYVDVDDVRQLVVAGAKAPWRGDEGAAQAALGSLNACALARNLLGAGFEVTIADVLTPATAAVVRERLSECFVVRLVVDLEEAERRATTRPVWITAEEFRFLHHRDRDDPPPADAVLDVTGLDPAAQRSAVEALWAASALQEVGQGAAQVGVGEGEAG